MVHIAGSPDGGVTAEFEPEEVTVLSGVLDEMAALLRAPHRAANNVTDRLFPKAYEDVEDQRAYEELMGDQLQAQKVAEVARVKRTLNQKTDPIVLEAEDAEAWLRVLNDVRLAIGTRLDVTEDLMGDEIAPDDPNGPAFAVLHWLGWVQESFLKELTHHGGEPGGSDA